MKALEVEVRPPSPFRLPGYSSEDRTMQVRNGVLSRLMRVEQSPILVRAWEPGRGRVLVRAESLDPAAVAMPRAIPVPPGSLAGPAARRRAGVVGRSVARAAAPRSADRVRSAAARSLGRPRAVV